MEKFCFFCGGRPNCHSDHCPEAAGKPKKAIALWREGYTDASKGELGIRNDDYNGDQYYRNGFQKGFLHRFPMSIW